MRAANTLVFVHASYDLYCIRINGRLGATALSAFPAMVHHVDGRETVLTGLLEDRSAVFGVLAQVEALGLELIELRQIRPRGRSGGSGDDCSPDLPALPARPEAALNG